MSGNMFDPVAVLETPGDRPQYVYGTDAVLVRLTRAGDGGFDEVWHVEVCEHPGVVSRFDDGFRYVGTIPRELSRIVLHGYLGGE